MSCRRNQHQQREKRRGLGADCGPSNKLGEISLACARAIGVPVDEGSPHPANSGGTESHTIHYQLFPGTAATVNGVTYPLQGS